MIRYDQIRSDTIRSDQIRYDRIGHAHRAGERAGERRGPTLSTRRTHLVSKAVRQWRLRSSSQNSTVDSSNRFRRRLLLSHQKCLRIPRKGLLRSACARGAARPAYFLSFSSSCTPEPCTAKAPGLKLPKSILDRPNFRNFHFSP